MAERRYRVAVVTPWFGADLTGGAERLAYQVAHGLAERGHTIEVFATCARGFASDWGVDAHQPGARDENGVLVRRFPVDARAANAFDRANEILLTRPLSYYRERTAAIEPDVAHDFIGSGINSTAAVDALRARLAEFDCVLVMPYPYGLPLAAVAAAGARAMFQPCLHDEPYAFLPEVENAFRRAGALVFNTPAERSLAYRLYGPSIALKSTLVGHWVERESQPPRLPPRVRGFRPADHRYVLYLGRRDASKNVDLLVESFARFRRNCRMLTLELVLVGPGRRSYGDARHGIRDLGLVDDAQKAALLAHAMAIVQPSVNESFSRTVMEGWNAGKPVAVNGRCPATADAVRESGGGWLATSKGEWSALFEQIDRMPPAQRELIGARGMRYAEEHTARERVLDRYEAAIAEFAGGRRATRFDVAAAPQLLRRLGDGRRTILFAGALAESACIDQLLAGFAFLLSFGIDARLVLAGEFDPSEPVADRFFDLVGRAQLTDRVVVLDRSQPEIVAACYRSADLFWSAADDGPRSELVDALGFGVPVFAFANDVSRRVLGDSGLLFNDKRDPRALAGAAVLLMTDSALRTTLLEGQRRRFDALRRDGELERAG
ncbi:MAG TPA: glycosyltransferase [Dongiaceae bacterium]|nr:glycosyltransferase [Dongiaceae bacterium]